MLVYLFNAIKVQCSFKKVHDKGCKLKKYYTFVKYQSDIIMTNCIIQVLVVDILLVKQSK